MTHLSVSRPASARKSGIELPFTNGVAVAAMWALVATGGALAGQRTSDGRHPNLFDADSPRPSIAVTESLAAPQVQQDHGPRSCRQEPVTDLTSLPPFPYFETEAFYVDDDLVETLAGEYCGSAGTEQSVEQFYYSYLPLTALDALCDSEDALATHEAWLGTLYISGYFGGIWLRDNLSESARAAAVRWIARSAIEYVAFHQLADVVGRLSAVAEDGGDGTVLSVTRASLPPVLSLYGYNLGYLEYLIAHPPEGLPSPGGALECGDYILECTSPSQELEVLDQFWPAISNLEHPRSLRWAAMNALVQEYAAGSLAAGEAVWEEILSDSDVNASAYNTLVDLSAGFLMASDAAALAAISSWAAAEPSFGRCAIMLEAGMTLWSGAYFMGLVSSAAPGTEPALTCP